jgi:hypothetical protein
LRKSYNKVSGSDIAAATLSLAKQTWSEMAKEACTYYELLDNAQTVDACAATLGSVYCALEMPAAIAIDAAEPIEECEVSWMETLSEDFGKCMSGIGDKVADAFESSKEFTTYNMNAHLDLGKTKEGVGDAFSLWCKDVEGESGRDAKDPAHPLGNVLAHGSSTGSRPPPSPGGSQPPSPPVGPVLPPGSSTPPTSDPTTPPPASPSTPVTPPATPPVIPPATQGAPTPGAPTMDPVPDAPDDPGEDNEGDGDTGGGIISGGGRPVLLLKDIVPSNAVHVQQLAQQLPTEKAASAQQKIPDSTIIKRNTARLIAKAYLLKTYGQADISAQRPYEQTLVHNYWVITGTGSKDNKKPGFLIIIDASSGEIVKVSD